jgi:hypothetical protein
MDQPTIQPDTAAGERDPFAEAVKEAWEIRRKYIDPQARWYEKHTTAPRLWFRGAGILTILLGAVLPAVAAAPDFPRKYGLISCMSVVIAVLTAASSFFHWERTWHGNMSAKIAIEQLAAKWELELSNARLTVAAGERIKHVYAATNDFLANVRSVTSSESEGFFSLLRFPQSGNKGGES